MVIKPLIGTDSTNLLEFGVTQRRLSDGVPLSTVTAPNYAMDYGMKKSVIVFHSPSADSNEMFKNYLDSVTFDTVTLNNITLYNPASSPPVFASFGNYITDLTLRSFNIDTVDAPLNQNAIFEIQNKGTLTVNSIVATNLEAVSYGYSTTDYNYVARVGPLFSFVSFERDATIGRLTYTLSNIQVTNTYGKKGLALYISEKSGTAQFHEIDLTVTSLQVSLYICWIN